jgi:hypothetical protein
LFSEVTGIREPQEKPAATLYFAPDGITTIPFIGPYIGIAKLLASHMFIAEPGLDVLELRGLEATNTLMPGIVKEEALAAIRTKVEARERQRSQAQS